MGDITNVTASEVTVGVARVVKCMIYDSYIHAIEVVTLGVACIAIGVRRGSDETAEITVDVAVVSVYVNGSFCLTFVTVGIAGVGVYVLCRLALQAANVALVVAVGIEAV